MFDCYICKNILIEPYFCSNCGTKFCNNCLNEFGNKCPYKNCDSLNFCQDVNLETELFKKSDLKCKKCNKTLKDYESYKIHDCFQCSLCDEKFKKDEKSFFNHLKEKHYEQIIKESKKN